MINFVNNLLSSTIIYIYERLNPINLNFIGKFIKWLIDSIGNVGIGIIIFTLCLKLITLPLDIYSKAAMRKNSLKMEEMRPQLEKLKKQYAHDKNMYNQKMMALYKKEGYSMFGACLPTIVTLVFFIVVLTAFQAFSKYETLGTFNKMMDAYTETAKEYSDGSYDIGANAVVIGEEKYDILIAKHNIEFDSSAADLTKAKSDAISEFIKNKAREASAAEFRGAKLNFLWVKNIWIADNATAHPVQSLDKFKSSVGRSITADRYDELTYNLAAEKKQPNGYFLLVVISVLVTMLSQFILGKGQKAQLELQSVDGQGMQTQKMMMYIMPIMIGVFALMYTAAFCLYLISNSFLTIISTVLINKIVEVKFKKDGEKKEMARLNARYNKTEKNRYKK